MIRHTEQLTAELAAVWEEMFDAVDDILKAAERIDGLAAYAGPGVSTEISSAVLQIFEACSFQDITGQRIANVASALSNGDCGGLRSAPVQAATPDEDLLNGPQLPGNALSQDCIDDMLGGPQAEGRDPAAPAVVFDAPILLASPRQGRILTQAEIDDLVGFRDEPA